VYVTKRPGVDEFLAEMAKYYEIVIYTASRDKYANPLLDILDEKRVIRKRLYREHCLFNEGTYVKDLSKLGRELKDTIIVDNAPHSYVFHPDNAIDCSSFIDDSADRELYQIGGFLKEIRNVRDVRNHCSQWKNFPNPAMSSSRSGSSRRTKDSDSGAVFV
jgi:RNA polymerase II subunit A small phosphatase-like protein